MTRRFLKLLAASSAGLWFLFPASAGAGDTDTVCQKNLAAALDIAQRLRQEKHDCQTQLASCGGGGGGLNDRVAGPKSVGLEDALDKVVTWKAAQLTSLARGSNGDVAKHAAKIVQDASSVAYTASETKALAGPEIEGKLKQLQELTVELDKHKRPAPPAAGAP